MKPVASFRFVCLVFAFSWELSTRNVATGSNLHIPLYRKHGVQKDRKTRPEALQAFALRNTKAFQTKYLHSTPSGHSDGASRQVFKTPRRSLPDKGLDSVVGKLLLKYIVFT
jgi:hypothetical protein